MLVIQIKVIDVAGAVVAIHNVPGESDVGAVSYWPLGSCGYDRPGQL